jgi:hypothetical protein
VSAEAVEAEAELPIPFQVLVILAVVAAEPVAAELKP